MLVGVKPGLICRVPRRLRERNGDLAKSTVWYSTTGCCISTACAAVVVAFVDFFRMLCRPSSRVGADPVDVAQN